MDLIFRSMNPDEAPGLRKLARKSFGPIEGWFVTKPEKAIVAVLDGKIVGGFMYEFEASGGMKIGIASFFFTDPAFQGQGIGKRLCEEGVRHLWSEGCDALVTFVRDDNVASWGAFEKNGFVLAGLPRLARLLGLPGFAKLCVKSTYGLWSIGHDVYVALRDEKSTSLCKKGVGFRQIIAYIIINTIFLLPFAMFARYTFLALAAVASVFLGMVLAGYLGTLFSKRRWHFRFTSGGGIMYLVINAAPRAFCPLIGNWYPDRYENTPKFRRDMAVNAIAVWVFLLGVAAAGAIASDSSVFLRYVSNIVPVLLVFRCLPVPVFESSGFGRVFKWNKIVFGMLVAASVFLIVFGEYIPRPLGR